MLRKGGLDVRALGRAGSAASPAAMADTAVSLPKFELTEGASDEIQFSRLAE